MKKNGFLYILHTIVSNTVVGIVVALAFTYINNEHNRVTRAKQDIEKLFVAVAKLEKTK